MMSSNSAAYLAHRILKIEGKIWYEVGLPNLSTSLSKAPPPPYGSPWLFSLLSPVNSKQTVVAAVVHVKRKQVPLSSLQTSVVFQPVGPNKHVCTALFPAVQHGLVVRVRGAGGRDVSGRNWGCKADCSGSHRRLFKRLGGNSWRVQAGAGAVGHGRSWEDGPSPQESGLGVGGRHEG